MMDTMHSGSDQHGVEHSFQTQGQAPIAMVKQGVCLKNQFVYRETPNRDSQDHHLEQPKTGRKSHFTKVKAKSGRDIEISINVMDVMKPPEQWDFMIGPVPIVETQVHQ